VLIKAKLHTDELMGAIANATTGLRTEWRLNHCLIVKMSGNDALLTSTDVAVNIIPTLADKVDIVQNMIDLACVPQFGGVRVAILTAVETVSEKMLSTVDAAVLCKMANRG
jgi:phosphate acetyltransferase